MIALGSDHGGFQLKEAIKKHMEEQGYEVKDFGCFDETSIDYPTIAVPVAKAVVSGECEKAILCCGTGLGMSIAANKVHGIRAACCSDCFSAKLTREHNDANMLAIGASMVGEIVALDIVDTFFATEFSHGERHQRRIDKIEG